jgi:hypothetical protein
MTISAAISCQYPSAKSRAQGKIRKPPSCGFINQFPHFSDYGSNENTDVLHREDFVPSTVTAAPGTFSVEPYDVHMGASLQVTQPYQRSVEGACMKNGNKLQSCLQIRGDLATALRRDTLKFRSAAKMLADLCGKSERTAANWLSGATGMSAEDALRVGKALPSVRALIFEMIAPPDDYTLAQELTMLRARLARAEARYREEFNVEPGAPDRLAFPMDAGASSEVFSMAPSPTGSMGTTPHPNSQKGGN